MENLSGMWAIQPSVFGLIIEAQAHGIKPAMSTPFITQQEGDTAIIPVHGVLDKYDSLVLRFFGGTAIEDISHAFKQAIANPTIKAIHFDIDSPGGSVNGTAELSELIYNSRGNKPITATANGLMASAAYWIGSAADSISLSSSTTIVGSIGVLSRHVDTSQREEAMGIKVTDIAAGKYKTITSQHAPLSDAGRETIQNQLDEIYTVFVQDVARNRGTSTENVLANMADGKVFIGQQALDNGLADSTAAHSTQRKEAPTMANDNQSIEEKAKSIWNTSAEIREEFMSFETYLAYSKADANGQVSILGGNVQKGAA